MLAAASYSKSCCIGYWYEISHLAGDRIAVVVWLQRAKKSIAANAGSPQGSAGASRNPFARKQRKEEAETMVQCAHCGIHFPASESVSNAAGIVYCSEEHLRLASS